MLYLDFASTTPIHPQVLDVYTQVASQYFGNANSLHDAGSSVKRIIEASSKVIAGAFNGSPKGITFTSGATESNYLAIQALLAGRTDGRNEIISSKMEHSSVINVLKRLAEEGYKIFWVDVHEDGHIDVDHLNQILSTNTAFYTQYHITNNFGTIYYIRRWM